MDASNASFLTDEELAALAEAQAKDEGEVIVIVGSTIERRELTTMAPVSIMDKAELETAGLATVGEIVQKMTAQSGGVNAQSNDSIMDGSTRADLRGLGARRTLVLLNGRRMVAGGVGADWAADMNTIPLAVVDRVEVLKDGASAVYGSDAIGGVINVITRNEMEGTNASIYTGASQRGDGIAYDVSIASGQRLLANKAHVMVSAGLQHQGAIMAGDREFSAVDDTFDFENRVAQPGGSPGTPLGRIDTRLIDADGNGAPDGGYSLCGMTMSSGGIAAPVPYCTLDINGGWRPFSMKDDLYNLQEQTHLYAPSQRYNVFSTVSYDLRDNVRLFAEGLYLNRSSSQQRAPELFSNIAPISKDNIYNPLGVSVLGYERRLEELGPVRIHEDIDTYRIVAGIDGQVAETAPLFKNWKWELSFNYGRSQATFENEGSAVASRLRNALGPSFIDADGIPRCGVPGLVIAGCVPLNLLGGTDSITPEMADYVGYTGVSTGFNEQRMALATAHGQVLKTPWDGDLSVAIGADYRQELGGVSPDQIVARGDSTSVTMAPTRGDYGVTEGFAELSFVPVTRRRFAEWVELSLAGRAFHYETFGNGLTGKAGALVRTIGGLAVRATYSTAFRAPSIFEMYRGTTSFYFPADDPCDTVRPSAGGTPNPLPPEVAARCAMQNVPADARFGTPYQRVEYSGKPDLEPETARVLTAGIVVEPPALKGLSFTLDYFRVRIQDALQWLPPNIVFNNCYNRGSDEYCARVHRDPNAGFAIDHVDTSSDNFGSHVMSSLDFAAGYQRDLGDLGKIRQALEATWLLGYELDNTVQRYQGAGVYDLGAMPHLKANLAAGWERRTVSGGLNVRYLHSFKECEYNTCAQAAVPGQMPRFRSVKPNVTADIFGSKTIDTWAGSSVVTLGINNVLDQAPPVVFSGLADSDPATYDYIGRYFYARLTHRF